MNKNGKKILLLVKDPEISGSVRKLCCHQAGEVDARMLDLESIDHAVSSQWNLLVLHIDSTLADRDVCGQIKAANPLGQIIVVADEADRTLGLDCLNLSADDLVVVPWNDVEFSARIGAAIRRNEQLLELQSEPAYVSSQYASASLDDKTPSYQFVGDVRLCLWKREVTVLERIIHLTRTEYSLLAYLFQRTSRPCSSVELLNNVLGYEDENYLPSLHSHVSRLRRKIQRSETTSIETIWCYGYRISIR